MLVESAMETAEFLNIVPSWRQRKMDKSILDFVIEYGTYDDSNNAGSANLPCNKA